MCGMMKAAALVLLGGIQSVSDLVMDTKKDQTRLLAAIDDVSAEFDKISTELSPVAPK